MPPPRRALLITGPGGVALLAGLLLLAHQVGSTEVTTIVHAAPAHSALVVVALVGILLGAFTKSAQFPFHSWLPAALDAPTPISAFLHASTMVKCGIYLIARFALLGSAFAFWLPTVLAVGVVSMFVGGYRAIRARDLNLLLAFGTVNQLGLLVVLFGIGTAATDRAAWMLLVAHAGFKSSMFMVVGIVERNTRTNVIGAIPRLGRDWRGLQVAAAIAAASMVGIPTMAGAVGKDASYVALLHSSFTGHRLTIAAIIISASCAAAYGWRFVRGIGVFGGTDTGADPTTDPPAPPLASFVIPMLALALAGPALGWAAGWVDQLAAAAVQDLGVGGAAISLKVFYGFGLPLAFSLTGFTLGGLWVVLSRRSDRRHPGAVSRRPTAR